MLFRRADTLGNECLDFLFGRQLDVVFLHKQIRIQATCCILDDRFPVVGTQKQAYRRIVIGRHHFVLVIVQVHIPGTCHACCTNSADVVRRIIAFSDSAVAVRRIASGSAI